MSKVTGIVFTADSTYAVRVARQSKTHTYVARTHAQWQRWLSLVASSRGFVAFNHEQGIDTRPGRMWRKLDCEFKEPQS